MGKNSLEKANAKFNSGLIDLEDVPEKLLRKWDRANFEKGHFRNKRNKKRYEGIS
jgi:hypothetical protein